MDIEKMSETNEVSSDIEQLSPQIGQILINNLLINGNDVNRSVIAWNYWTCTKIVEKFTREYSSLYTNDVIYGLIKLKNAKYDSLKEKYNDLEELSRMIYQVGEKLIGNIPIKDQFEDFKFGDNSYPSYDYTLFIFNSTNIEFHDFGVNLHNVFDSNYLNENLPQIITNFDEEFESNLPWDYTHPDDDLVKLEHLSEQTLLQKLNNRFRNGCFYSYIGNILIFTNPYCSLPIYNPKYSNIYRNHVVDSRPPHIFGLVDRVYYQMLNKKSSQCILISGESGSGKTECSKQIVQHITYLNQYGAQSQLVSAILASSNVLEAFGNAHSFRNTNSSRFGKFTEILFSKDVTITKMLIKIYLIEKSRIVVHDQCERNFHIFYYILSINNDQQFSASETKKIEDYQYLQPNTVVKADPDEDSKEFKKLKNCMTDLNFSNETQTRLFSVVLAILNIGNIEIDFGSDLMLPLDPCIELASSLLKIDSTKFKQLLFNQSQKIGEEKIMFKFSSSKVKSVRDSLAKILYTFLFEWIVKRVNFVLKNKDTSAHCSNLSIGILDIFGFENLNVNSFEQFCINYVNERLQMFMNEYTLKIQQDEYEEEGFGWDRINYIDNSNTVRLFIYKPHGLIPLLEDECRLREGSDINLLRNFNNYNNNNSSYSVQNNNSCQFIIKHYASTVIYNIDGFKEKNCNYVNENIINLLKQSKCYLVRELTIHRTPKDYWVYAFNVIKVVLFFSRTNKNKRCQNNEVANLNENDVLTELTVNKKTKIKSTIRERTSWFLAKAEYYSTSSKIDFKRTKSDNTNKELKQNFGFLTNYFQNSLGELFRIFLKCECHFVKCLRPNAESKALCFDSNMMLTQLKYSGLIQTIQIRQSGYSYRYKKDDFLKKFKLLFSTNLFSNNDLESYFEKNNIIKKMYQIGKSKVSSSFQYKDFSKRIGHLYPQ